MGQPTAAIAAPARSKSAARSGQLPVGSFAAVSRPSETTRCAGRKRRMRRSEEHTSELQSLMRTSYAVFCLKKKNQQSTNKTRPTITHILQLDTNTENYT